MRWRARGTFAGPGPASRGSSPTARDSRSRAATCSRHAEDQIERHDAYLDSGDVARQLGLLPPAGSRAEANLTKLANVRTRARAWIQGGEPERIAEGVWLVRGGIPKVMNVYLIEDEGGVTVFDAGASDMAAPVAAAGAGSAGSGGSCSATPTPITAAPPRAWTRRSTATPPSATPPSPQTHTAILGPFEARSPRPHGSLAAARDMGRRRGERSPARSTRATRSPASGSSTCPATRPG